MQLERLVRLGPRGRHGKGRHCVPARDVPGYVHDRVDAVELARRNVEEGVESLVVAEHAQNVRLGTHGDILDNRRREHFRVRAVRVVDVVHFPQVDLDFDLLAARDSVQADEMRCQINLSAHSHLAREKRHRKRVQQGLRVRQTVSGAERL
eukprot:Amastigsp_a841386_271.p3 type:complete len:151 gc:universal Amastigsp_a841386_271:594-142(-)